jgi:hypothetical protein
MSMRSRTVLPVGLDSETVAAAVEAVVPLQAVVTARAEDWAEAAELASAGRYDALLVGYPLVGDTTCLLLKTIRRVGCPCRDSAVVLLAAERDRANAEEFVGRGANRVVGRNEMGIALADVLERLFAASPRTGVRVPSRIAVPGRGFTRHAFCQTVDVSESGMLLCTPHGYDPGTELGFELDLPACRGKVVGKARVVRRADGGHDDCPRVGVAFTRLEPVGRQRLLAFLRHHAC